MAWNWPTLAFWCFAFVLASGGRTVSAGMSEGSWLAFALGLFWCGFAVHGLLDERTLAMRRAHLDGVKATKNEMAKRHDESLRRRGL